MSRRSGPRLERRLLTPDQDEWFKQNVTGRTCSEMAELVTETFGIPITKEQIKSYMGRHHLQNGCKWRPGPRPELRILNPEQAKWFKENVVGRSYREMGEMVTKELGVPMTEDQVKAYMARYHLQNGRDGRIKPGNVPPNKGKKGQGGWPPTQFKKGQAPTNYRPVGSERIDTDGYVWVKTEDPKKWRMKHVLNWEKERGAVPQGHALLFADGNKQNTDIENLILISRAQLAVLNHQRLLQKDKTLNETAILTADLILGITAAKRRIKKENKTKRGRNKSC